MQELEETQILSVGWEDLLEEENDKPLGYSYLENAILA